MKYDFMTPVQKETVDTAKADNFLVMMMVDGFQTIEEAVMLRDMLWYARDNGVEVHFIPPVTE